MCTVNGGYGTKAHLTRTLAGGPMPEMGRDVGYDVRYSEVPDFRSLLSCNTLAASVRTELKLVAEISGIISLNSLYLEFHALLALISSIYTWWHVT